MSLSDKIGYVDKNHIKVGTENANAVLGIKDVKEFIRFEKARRENQLRIHWKWLKNTSYEEVVKFLNAITDKKAGEELI